MFQHTAARRRLGYTDGDNKYPLAVSTHSRPKAAGFSGFPVSVLGVVSTHSRPKAAGLNDTYAAKGGKYVSTHSRPKAAGLMAFCSSWIYWFQHTAARRRLAIKQAHGHASKLFQHTAARRRLANVWAPTGKKTTFQHTAARRRLGANLCRVWIRWTRFNTQPPEGGWVRFANRLAAIGRFNTQPPEGGWSLSQKPCSIRFRSPDFAKLLRKARMRV